MLGCDSAASARASVRKRSSKSNPSAPSGGLRMGFAVKIFYLKDLERDVATELGVLGQVDHGHAAARDEPVDHVPSGDALGGLRDRAGHLRVRLEVFVQEVLACEVIGPYHTAVCARKP